MPDEKKKVKCPVCETEYEREETSDKCPDCGWSEKEARLIIRRDREMKRIESEMAEEVQPPKRKAFDVFGARR